MNIIVLKWNFDQGIAYFYCVWVFHETDVSHIASAEVDDVGSRSDKTREANRGVLA